MSDDDDSPSSEQRKSKAFPEPIDAKSNNTLNAIRQSEDSNVDNSQMGKVIVINYDQIHKPEVSYSSMHNGLSSPEPNEKEAIEASTTDLKEHMSSSNLCVIEKPKSNDSFVEVEANIPTGDEEQSATKRNNIISLYDNILQSNLSHILQPFYYITVKEEVKDKLIGFHKVYEVSLYSKLGNEKQTKCYQRYDNFNKLHQRIIGKYPFIMIPRVTPKNPLVKILNFEEEFYENRRLQLIFYLNFIANHPILCETKEFNKFINDASFDDSYFAIDESPMTSSLFSSPSDLIKTKLITVWNYLGVSGTGRKLNDCEVLINKMAIHYKNIIDKFTQVKTSICSYIKAIKEDSSEYKALSEALFYVKDSIEHVDGSKEKLSKYSKHSGKIASANNKHYLAANQLENKLEALLSLLLGICDAFDKYAEFIKRYENVTLMLKNAKENNMENINVIIGEYDMCEILKNKFDVNLSHEANDYIELFDNVINEVLEQFRTLLLNINTDILE